MIVAKQFFSAIAVLAAALLLSGILLRTAAAQTSGSLPVAITVPVVGVGEAGGELVLYNANAGTYSVSRAADAPNVFGVTVERPPLLFATASNTTPVITQGAAYLKVNDSRGLIARGDLLVSAVAAGTAAKAELESEQVFAMALEDASPGVSTILVQFDPAAAKSLAIERRKEAEDAKVEGEGGFFGTADPNAEDAPGLVRQLFEKYTRGTLAAIIAIGSLFFIMYTFRTTILNATLAVGRNPRARNAIMTVSVENIIFALIIFVVAIFIAIAVLVLPV